MKRLWGIVLAVLLAIPGMAAALEESAAAIVMAKLMEAPREDAAVLMEYYPGSRVSVLGEALRVLPQENFVYLGDTKHIPYGDKPPELVFQYTHDAIERLVGLG